ncbi:MAG: 4a-hydroxytetrahydrobiopterin dehydratase [Bacteroidetes bacterium QS_7_67_15]|jgi:4a-hydroxytetrahydrobiopterin dehydratase|nr:MAG: 4a-hydroxytetrahydrobiopterin dehydratase [Bacteroidetes bacterium QH_8_67_23]PSQ83099.1 MAG: 4a-hydroxytetrahydrobiopterin dehydratase [Bacteroidetes bacterium QS_7_67_15]
MPDREPLSDDEIRQALSGLDGWTHPGDKLQKTFEREDFRDAVSFIVRIAFYAEEMNHHPELENVYDTVDVALTTHDAGGKVTEMDLELARKIESVA